MDNVNTFSPTRFIFCSKRLQIKTTKEGFFHAFTAIFMGAFETTVY